VPNAQVSISALRNGSTLSGTFPTDQNGVSGFQLPKADSYIISVSNPAFTSSQTSFDYPLSPAMTITLTHLNASAASTSGVTFSPPDAGSVTGPNPSDSTQQPNENQFGWLAFTGFVLLALLVAFAPLIVFFGLREVSVRLVTAYMMRKSKSSKTASSEAAPQPVKLDSVDSATIEETVRTGDRAEMGFLEVNATNGVILSGRSQERLERALKTAGRGFRVFVASLWLQGLFALLVATPYAVKFHLHALPELRQGAIPAAIMAGAVALAALFFTVIGLISWVNSERLETVVVVLSILIQATIAIVVWQAAHVPLYIALPGVVAGIAYLAWGFRRIKKEAKTDGNKRMLILRVFGSDKNAAYTFGKLMKKWRFVGSLSTIVDPSYIRYQFSVFNPANSRRSIGIALWYGLAAALLLAVGHYLQPLFPGLFPAKWMALTPDQQQAYLRIVAYVALSPLAVIAILLYVRHRFVASSSGLKAQIDKIMQSERSPGIGGIFRGLSMFCFDDVWKPAVGSMLKSADVVLMDLRGFRRERKGCAYEIGEVMNRFPVGKVLLLVDDKCDKGELYKLVRESWRTIRPDSPNQALEEPLIKVYEACKRRKHDVPRILAMLSACVDEVAQVRERHLAFVGGENRRPAHDHPPLSHTTVPELGGA
jgi:hypothetical protein